MRDVVGLFVRRGQLLKRIKEVFPSGAVLIDLGTVRDETRVVHVIRNRPSGERCAWRNMGS